MAHKFIIEVTLKHEETPEIKDQEEQKENTKPKEQPQPKAVVNLDPRIIANFLPQVMAMAAKMQPIPGTKPPVASKPPVVN